ncbi:MAG: hypothetical protein Q9170_006320 [Blastenia crenularia]
MEKTWFETYFARLGLLDNEPTLLAEFEQMDTAGGARQTFSRKVHWRYGEFIIVKTDILTGVTTEKRQNPAELRSQGAMAFDAARSSSLVRLTPQPQGITDSQTLDSIQVRERMVVQSFISAIPSEEPEGI